MPHYLIWKTKRDPRKTCFVVDRLNPVTLCGDWYLKEAIKHTYKAKAKITCPKCKQAYEKFVTHLGERLRENP